MRDTDFRITALTDRDAAEMVRGIRGHVLLEGFRGQPPADLAAIEDLLLRVSWLADTVQIAEMDLNPIVVHPPGKGLLAIDVRVAISVAGRYGFGPRTASPQLWTHAWCRRSRPLTFAVGPSRFG